MMGLVVCIEETEITEFSDSLLILLLLRALVNMVMNLQVPWKVGNSLTSWMSVSISRRTLLSGVNYVYDCVRLKVFVAMKIRHSFLGWDTV